MRLLRHGQLVWLRTETRSADAVYNIARRSGRPARTGRRRSAVHRGILRDGFEALLPGLAAVRIQTQLLHSYSLREVLFVKKRKKTALYVEARHGGGIACASSAMFLASEPAATFGAAFRIIALVLAASASVSAGADTPLRVCADPHNMPFSNVKGEGFENRLAALVASELNRPLAYFWSPLRRGFTRNLQARRCDVVMGVPAHYAPLQTTQPYYRSSYVFVTRQDRHLQIESFDDAKLKALTVGIQVVGDEDFGRYR